MTTEVTRRSELAEFVSDHVFSYVNGNKLISVVDSDRLTLSLIHISEPTRH